jgi:hypothetical protein
MHTQIVRGAKVSKKRIKVVALPYQNQAGGDGFRLLETTFCA